MNSQQAKASALLLCVKASCTISIAHHTSQDNKPSCCHPLTSIASAYNAASKLLSLIASASQAELTWQQGWAIKHCPNLPPPFSSTPRFPVPPNATVYLVLLVQAVVNEDTTADALLLHKENERLRKELEMFRQLQQVTLCCHHCHCSSTPAALVT